MLSYNIWIVDKDFGVFWISSWTPFEIQPNLVTQTSVVLWRIYPYYSSELQQLIIIELERLNNIIIGM